MDYSVSDIRASHGEELYHVTFTDNELAAICHRYVYEKDKSIPLCDYFHQIGDYLLDCIVPCTLSTNLTDEVERYLGNHLNMYSYVKERVREEYFDKFQGAGDLKRIVARETHLERMRWCVNRFKEVVDDDLFVWEEFKAFLDRLKDFEYNPNKHAIHCYTEYEDDYEDYHE